MRRPDLGAVGLAVGLIATPLSAQVLERADDGAFVQVGPGWEQPAARAPATPLSSRNAVAAAAERYSLSPDLIDAVARTESGYRQNAVSAKGAQGVMQLMPATALGLGVDPRDPVQNIMGGAAYLRAQLDRFDGDIEKALAAYNAGPNAVARYGGVPPYRETQAYVAANLDRLAGAVTSPLVSGDRR